MPAETTRRTIGGQAKMQTGAHNWRQPFSDRRFMTGFTARVPDGGQDLELRAYVNHARGGTEEVHKLAEDTTGTATPESPESADYSATLGFSQKYSQQTNERGAFFAVPAGESRDIDCLVPIQPSDTLYVQVVNNASSPDTPYYWNAVVQDRPPEFADDNPVPPDREDYDDSPLGGLF